MSKTITELAQDKVAENMQTNKVNMAVRLIEEREQHVAEVGKIDERLAKLDTITSIIELKELTFGRNDGMLRN